MIYLTENGIYLQLDNIGISYEYSVLDEYLSDYINTLEDILNDLND